MFPRALWVSVDDWSSRVGTWAGPPSPAMATARWFVCSLACWIGGGPTADIDPLLRLVPRRQSRVWTVTFVPNQLGVQWPQSFVCENAC
ncbi:hypothetical protein BCR44DRAFT_1441572 [Catenaria anguillulae PL171]|uniref:Uncharacterized protein n=1 Tax=Catenaria anguillulae PL171 TaxID=765915 RepID=A0A1Y2HAY9_9FUNG|nr:hypothetical protein BCR44DRAFT_1441572 [Catenaria anguillulae PL171]